MASQSRMAVRENSTEFRPLYWQDQANPVMAISVLQRLLANVGVNVHSSTVQRNLNNGRMSRKGHCLRNSTSRRSTTMQKLILISLKYSGRKINDRMKPNN